MSEYTDHYPHPRHCSSSVAGLRCCGGGVFLRVPTTKFQDILKDQLRWQQAFAAKYVVLGLLALYVIYPMERIKHGWLWPWAANARKEAGIE